MWGGAGDMERETERDTTGEQFYFTFFLRLFWTKKKILNGMNENVG